MLFQVGFIDFRQYVLYLQDVGFYDVFLPFLLIFAIVFAILDKTHILGSKKGVSVVVAVVVGALVTVRTDIVTAINDFLPGVSLILVVALMFIILMALLVGQPFTGLQGFWFLFAAVIGIIALISTLNPNWSNYFSAYERDQILFIGAMVLGIIGAVWLIVGGSDELTKEEKDRAYNDRKAFYGKAWDNITNPFRPPRTP